MRAALRVAGAPGERAHIQAALQHIPADDRELWVRIGMAIKAGLGEEGFALWDDWSRSSQRYRENDARSTWRSIRADGGIHLGTLFFEAEQRGYVQSGFAKAKHVPGTPVRVPAAERGGEVSPPPPTRGPDGSHALTLGARNVRFGLPASAVRWRAWWRQETAANLCLHRGFCCTESALGIEFRRSPSNAVWLQICFTYRVLLAILLSNDYQLSE